jgi:NADPH:quinone reductase-like Zn-dependent oxidoreductase
MRAVQVTDLSGPDSALKLADIPEPEPSHMLTPGRGVVVDVHSAGVSFPEVLQTRGEYQIKPPLPFVPGSEVVGAGWGAYVLSKPEVSRALGAELHELIEGGFVCPLVGARFPLERAAEALELIDGRGATGKVVLDVRPG